MQRMQKLLALFGLSFVLLFAPMSSVAHAQIFGGSADGGVKGGLTNLKDKVPDYNNNNIVDENGNVVDLIAKIIKYALYLVGAISVLFVIYGGFLYLTSG